MFAASALATIVVGRLIAGFGVGFVSAIIILYMVRSAPRALSPCLLVGADFFPSAIVLSPFSYSSAPRLVSSSAAPYTQSEICPKKVRGALVSGYRESPRIGNQKKRSNNTDLVSRRTAEFCITIGLMLGSIVDNYTQKRTDSGAYRIPIGIQVRPPKFPSLLLSMLIGVLL